MCSDNLWSRTQAYRNTQMTPIVQHLCVIAGLDGSLIRSGGHVCRIIMSPYDIFPPRIHCWVYYYYYCIRCFFFPSSNFAPWFLGVSCFYGSRRTVNVMDSLPPLPRPFTDQQLSKTKRVFFFLFYFYYYYSQRRWFDFHPTGCVK